MTVRIRQAIHGAPEPVDDASQELVADHRSWWLGEPDDTVATADAVGRPEDQRGAALGPDGDDLADPIVTGSADANSVTESKA